MESEANNEQVAYILGGSCAVAVLGGWGLLVLSGCGGFILTVAIVVIAVCYKQKKACFKRFSDVNITQTMPIENFKGYQEESEKKGLSFKGRMPSMKRAASVKQNRADSELVNVQHHKLENVSGEIQDSERKGTF